VNLDDSTLEWRKLNELLPELKNGLVSVFTDSFVTRLLETHNEYTTVEQGFIEALVRRIKRLLQFIVVK
jgi:nuclear pore complex protein Nup205